MFSDWLPFSTNEPSHFFFFKVLLGDVFFCSVVPSSFFSSRPTNEYNVVKSLCVFVCLCLGNDVFCGLGEYSGTGSAEVRFQLFLRQRRFWMNSRFLLLFFILTIA